MTTPFVQPELSFIDVDGRRIAVRHRRAAPGQPTVMFLPGYASDMDGIKANAIDRFAAAAGLACLRMDYSGTGSSQGEFAAGTLDRWLDEVVAAVDDLVEGPVVLVGSSMGGWVALLAALRRPQKVAALLGIAAAPDFTNWGYSADEKATLARDGKLERRNPNGPEVSVTHGGFWQSGEGNRLLDAPIALAIPVRLIHGIEDRAVPVSIALQLVDRLESPDVQLRLIKSGGHNLSEPPEIDTILAELRQLVDLCRAYTT